MRKKVALTDTRQKQLLTQFSPQNITAQQGPGRVNGGSCHKYNFCRNESFVTVSIFCHNERRFVVVTNTILEQYATLTDNGCKIMDTC